MKGVKYFSWRIAKLNCTLCKVVQIKNNGDSHLNSLVFFWNCLVLVAKNFKSKRKRFTELENER